MNKAKLRANLNANKSTTKTCLQTLWDNINKGQRKQIIKNEQIKEMFDRYGVEYEE